MKNFVQHDEAAPVAGLTVEAIFRAKSLLDSQHVDRPYVAFVSKPVVAEVLSFEVGPQARWRRAFSEARRCGADDPVSDARLNMELEAQLDRAHRGRVASFLGADWVVGLK